MSDFRTYVMDVAEVTHSVAYITFSVEDDAEEVVVFSADESAVLFVNNKQPWGDMLQEFKKHVLY